MAGSVFNKFNQLPAGCLIVSGFNFIQQIANHVYRVDVGHFATTADVIGLSPGAVFHYFPDGPAVIFHIQPVSYIAAVTINREGLIFQGV